MRVEEILVGGGGLGEWRYVKGVRVRSCSGPNFPPFGLKS